ncbi:hypothetical protein HDU98_000472 [Podochytrium sp. JEL0797]|nr:hypothetical protein HDU98_000472 [Podochytrium sp. JEL0797]
MDRLVAFLPRRSTSDTAPTHGSSVPELEGETSGTWAAYNKYIPAVQLPLQLTKLFGAADASLPTTHPAPSQAVSAQPGESGGAVHGLRRSVSEWAISSKKATLRLAGYDDAAQAPLQNTPYLYGQEHVQKDQLPALPQSHQALQSRISNSSADLLHYNSNSASLHEFQPDFQYLSNPQQHRTSSALTPSLHPHFDQPPLLLSPLQESPATPQLNPHEQALQTPPTSPLQDTLPTTTPTRRQQLAKIQPVSVHHRYSSVDIYSPSPRSARSSRHQSVRTPVSPQMVAIAGDGVVRSPVDVCSQQLLHEGGGVV